MKKGINVGHPRHQNALSGSVLCRHDRAVLAKSANIWLSGRHVANMPAILPAKRGANRPIEHIQGFTRSHWHWMPPSVKCLRHITPAAAMVGEFEWNTQNTTKIQLLASNYGTFRLLVVCENFYPKTSPLLSSSMRQASFKCETLRLELESSAAFLAIKCCQWSKLGKVITLARSLWNKWALSAPIGVKLLNEPAPEPHGYIKNAA